MEARALTAEPDPADRDRRARAIARRRAAERGRSFDDEALYLEAQAWARLARDQAAELVELERAYADELVELEREQLLDLLRDTEPRAP